MLRPSKFFSGMSKHFLETHRFVFFILDIFSKKNPFFVKVMSKSRFFKEFVCNLQSICRKDYTDLKIKHRSQFLFCDHENFFGESKDTF